MTGVIIQERDYWKARALEAERKLAESQAADVVVAQAVYDAVRRVRNLNNQLDGVSNGPAEG